LGALAAAGFATTTFGKKRSFSRQFAAAADNSEEQSILLLEEFGRIAHEHDGTCDEMAAKTRAFQDQHADAIERMQIEQVAWPDDRLARHADTYGERRLVVVDQVNAAYERCQALSPGGATGTPFATPIVAPLATPQASPAADRDNGDRLGFFQQTEACTPSNYNFKPDAFCHNGDWSSPSFQWPAYCPMDVIDDTCELCTQHPDGIAIDDWCTKWWPQDCLAPDGTKKCKIYIKHGGGGVAGANCDVLKETQSPTAQCHSRKSDWSSPTFKWPAVCSHTVIDQYCVLCTEDYAGHVNPDFCAQTWPQDCHSTTEGNICYIGYHIPEGSSCCEQNCPISTVSCALHIFASFTGDYHCAGCLSSWCGSTDRCLEDCKANDCCDGACGESDSGLPFDDGDDDDDTTDFPGGESRRGGTPVPIGTPDVAPTEEPPPEVPTEAPSTPPIATPLS
jgi:hypothetical protein